MTQMWQEHKVTFVPALKATVSTSYLPATTSAGYLKLPPEMYISQSPSLPHLLHRPLLHLP